MFNGAIDDLVADANAARPISAGGTGSGTKSGAQASLGVIPQASTSDATSGRLLQVGGFGWGGTGIAVPGDDCNSITVTGVYAGVGGTTLNMPADAAFTIVHYQRSSNGIAMQVAYRNTSGLTYKRSRDTNGWQEWRQVEGIESSGTNVNGTFIKYESGLIQCWHSATFTAAISTALVGGFRSAVQSWTFPCDEYVGGPQVFINAVSGTAFGAVRTDGVTGTTLCNYAVTAPVSQSSASRSVSLYAIGY